MSAFRTEPNPTQQLGEYEEQEMRDEKSSVDGQATPVPGEGLVKSRYDHLTIRQSLWTFRRSLLVCFCVFTGRMLEFFEIVMSGGILANPGFVKQFGRPGMFPGVSALDPNWGELPNTLTGLT